MTSSNKIGKIDISALKIGIDKIILEGRSNNRLTLSGKLTKTYSNNIRNRQHRISVNMDSNNPTEDTIARSRSKGLIEAKRALSNIDAPNKNTNTPIFSRNESVNKKSSDKNIFRARTSMDFHGRERQLKVILGQKELAIKRMTRKNLLLKAELETLKKKISKSVGKRVENVNNSTKNNRRFEKEENNEIHLFNEETKRGRPSFFDSSAININKKLANTLGIVKNLEKCIMGIQCDAKLLESKRNQHGAFREELDNLKDRIKVFVELSAK